MWISRSHLSSSTLAWCHRGHGDTWVAEAFCTLVWLPICTITSKALVLKISQFIIIYIYIHWPLQFSMQVVYFIFEASNTSEHLCQHSQKAVAILFTQSNISDYEIFNLLTIYELPLRVKNFSNFHCKFLNVGLSCSSVFQHSCMMS